jgi:tetratricopeptide (TPR) repeat protein
MPLEEDVSMKKVLMSVAVLVVFLLMLTNCQNAALTSAKVYMQQSNWDKAIEQAQLSLQTMPNDPEAYYVLGLAYGSKNEYMLANEAFKKSLSFSPKHEPEIKQQQERFYVDLFNNGVNMVKQDKLVEATANFKMAIDIKPERTGAYKNLAFTYTKMQKDSMAIDVYLKAIQIDPKDLELKNFLGTLYYRNQKYDKAIAILTEITNTADKQSKSYSEAIYSLAYSFDLSGQPEKAIETYQKALESVPDDKDLMFNLGRLYFMQNKYDEAVENFLKVLAQQPDDFEANMNVGNAYQQLKKYEEALPYHLKATQINPSNYTAWYYLSRDYVFLHRDAEGKAAYEKSEMLVKEEKEKK